MKGMSIDSLDIVELLNNICIAMFWLERDMSMLCNHLLPVAKSKTHGHGLCSLKYFLLVNGCCECYVTFYAGVTFHILSN